MNTDPIADYLTRIRNASRARHGKTIIPYSKLKEGISKVLQKKKYIEDFLIKDTGEFKELEILLNPWDKEPLHLKRISKPGQRIFIKSKDIKKVRNGLGMLVISTPNGIMSNDEAYRKNTGGEVICEIY